MTNDQPESKPGAHLFSGAQRAGAYIEDTSNREEIDQARKDAGIAPAESREDVEKTRVRPIAPPPPPLPQKAQQAPTQGVQLEPRYAPPPTGAQHGAPETFGQQGGGVAAANLEQSLTFHTPEDDLTALGTSNTVDPATRPAETGLRGFLTRVGIKMQPNAKEVAARQAEAELRACEERIRQATWTRAVSLLVANRKGGVGKTPVAVLIGGIIAAIRGGSVAIMEVADDPNRTNFRSEGDPKRGIGQLLADLDKITSAGQLTGYTAPQTSFASVIGTVGRRSSLSGDDVKAMSALIDQYYEFRVMDSGNQYTSSAFVGAVSVTDVLVIPFVDAGDAVLDMIELLDEMRALGGEAAGLADNAVLIRLHHAPVSAAPSQQQINQRIERIIASANVGQVFDVPFDQHIAEKSQLTLSKLQPATRDAFIRAAAGIVQTLQNTVK